MPASETPIADLWQAAHDCIALVLRRFQRASENTRVKSLFAQELKEMRAWLRGLEAYLRQVLLIEAAGIDLPPPRPHLYKHVNTARAAARLRRREAAPPRSVVRLWPRARHRARLRQLGPPLLVREIWRETQRAALIARLRNADRPCLTPAVRFLRRVEAIERLLHNRRAAARRLARRLRLYPRSAHAISTASIPVDQRFVYVYRSETYRRADAAALTFALDSS